MIYNDMEKYTMNIVFRFYEKSEYEKIKKGTQTNITFDIENKSYISKLIIIKNEDNFKPYNDYDGKFEVEIDDNEYLNIIPLHTQISFKNQSNKIIGQGFIVSIYNHNKKKLKPYNNKIFSFYSIWGYYEIKKIENYIYSDRLNDAFNIANMFFPHESYETYTNIKNLNTEWNISIDNIRSEGEYYDYRNNICDKFKEIIEEFKEERYVKNILLRNINNLYEFIMAQYNILFFIVPLIITFGFKLPKINFLNAQFDLKIVFDVMSIVGFFIMVAIYNVRYLNSLTLQKRKQRSIDNNKNDTQKDVFSREFSVMWQRINNEIKVISTITNYQLVIGLIMNIVGIIIIGFVLFGDVNGTKNIDTWVSFLFFLLPKLSFLAFIGTISFYFLSMYKASLNKRTFYQNELTDIELKFIAIKNAIKNIDSSKNEDLIKSISNELLKSDKNKVIKKDETTIELEKMKIDSEKDKLISEKLWNMLNIINSKNTDTKPE